LTVLASAATRSAKRWRFSTASVFVRNKVYLQYADRFMNPNQIDVVDHSNIPGYVP
jgi:hypothetical protein